MYIYVNTNLQIIVQWRENHIFIYALIMLIYRNIDGFNLSFAENELLRHLRLFAEAINGVL